MCSFVLKNELIECECVRKTSPGHNKFGNSATSSSKTQNAVFWNSGVSVYLVTDLFWPLCLHSKVCGSARKNTTSLDHPSSIASASKAPFPFRCCDNCSLPSSCNRMYLYPEQCFVLSLVTCFSYTLYFSHGKYTTDKGELQTKNPDNILQVHLLPPSSLPTTWFLVSSSVYTSKRPTSHMPVV